MNDGRAVSHEASGLLERIAAHVAAQPQAVGVSFAGAEWDYASVWERARAIGFSLRQEGVTAETRVGIHLERGPHLVPALLGTLMAGGCYVPLEPRYPAERLRWMVHDAGIRHVVSSGAGGALEHGDFKTIDLDAPLAAAPVEWQPAPMHDGQAVYAIYTSGSTGRPKGVINTHAALLNRLQWMQDAYVLTAADRVLQKTPFTFDVSVWEFFWPLCEGACIVLAVPDGHRDFAYLADLIARETISRLHFVPSMLDGFLSTAASRAMPNLRQILCSGEALPTPVAERCLQQFPQATLDNLYGPTEAAIDVSFHRCAVGEPVPSQPIGVAIDGIDLHVLDESLHPVADGVSGELFIGGIGLARGYVGRPDLTAERFVPHPLAAGPGMRLYRTGDLVCRRADGCIDYLGRLDFQVKINGQRIELSEIENVLREHAEVAAALVTDCAGPGNRRQLAAYITLQSGTLRRAGADRSVRTWQTLYDQVYAGLAGHAAEPRDNFLSWNSSEDGLPLPLPAMRAWADEALSRILQSAPRRVLEIGCGSGLIASRLLPYVAHYAGIDPSAMALDYLRTHIDADAAGRMVLAQGFAHDIPDAIGTGFDTVVLNSVVQYFPDTDYLQTVLDDCVLRLGTPGELFIGDVRDARLQAAFLAGLSAAPQETELVLDPAFFLGWAARQPFPVLCEVLPKTGGYDNELARYRFDVRMHIRPRVQPWTPARRVDWNAHADWQALAAIANEGDGLQVDGIPMPRLRDSLDRVRDTDRATEAARAACLDGAQDPAPLADLLARRGLRAEWRLDVDRPGLYIAAVVSATREALLLAGHSTRPPEGTAARLLRNSLSLDAAALVLPFLRERLPDYMIPAHVIVLDALPLNTNGKVDRKQLPAIFQSDGSTISDESLPRTDMERRLAAVWARLLQRESVPRDVSFYRLGGDSILLAQMVMQAAAEGVRIRLADALAHPRLDALAAAVADAAGQDPSDLPSAADYDETTRAQLVTMAANHRPVERVVPLPDLVAGIVMEAAASPVPGANSEVVTFEALNVDPLRFEQAWQALIARHEILRSGFSLTGTHKAAQFIYRAVDWAPRYLDWRGLSATEQGAAWERLYGEAWLHKFDMASAPLMQVTAVRLDSERTRVLWVLHHAVTDGWTYAVLLRDWLHAYDGRALAPVGLGYHEFSAWLRAAERHPSLRDYWQRYLAGFDPQESRLPPCRGQGGSLTVMCRTAVVDATARDRLDDLLERAEATWNTLIEVIWGGLLASLAGRRQATFGSLCSLRPLGPAGSEFVAGPAFNIVPVRVDARGSRDVSLIEQVRKHFSARALHAAHAHVNPLLLQQCAGLDLHQPLFESLVAFENMPSIEDERLLRAPRFDSRSARPLVLLIWPDDVMRLELYGNSGRFNGEWLEARLATVTGALMRLANNPSLSLVECLAEESTEPADDNHLLEIEI